jgi:hypothetical protein
MTNQISRSEFQRLGKRGSYRLGLLAPQGVGRPAPQKQFRPSFSRPTRTRSRWAWTAAVLIGVGLIAVSASAGLWFMPFAVGLAGGLAVRWAQWRLLIMGPAIVAVSALGWGAALAYPALRGLPVGATARTIAAISGLPAFAAVGIAMTLGIAVLLGLIGLWLGRALTPRSPA